MTEILSPVPRSQLEVCGLVPLALLPQVVPVVAVDHTFVQQVQGSSLFQYPAELLVHVAHGRVVGGAEVTMKEN